MNKDNFELTTNTNSVGITPQTELIGDVNGEVVLQAEFLKDLAKLMRKHKVQKINIAWKKEFEA